MYRMLEIQCGRNKSQTCRVTKQAQKPKGLYRFYLFILLLKEARLFLTI